MLSELTPLAALGLGLCLAYLKLDRFRYHQSFQIEARRVLKGLQLRREGLEESLGNTAYYLGLKLLAHWSDPLAIRAIKKSMKENVKIRTPIGWRIFLYRVLFEPPLPRSMWFDPKDRFKLRCPGSDRLVVTLLASLSLLFLVLGRAHLLKIVNWDILAYVFDDRFVLIWSVILLICLLLPIVLAPIGDFILRGIRRNIEHIDEEFKKFLKRQGEEIDRTDEELKGFSNNDDLWR